MKITPWTKVRLYEAITRHTMDAAYPRTRLRGNRTIITDQDPDARRKAAACAAARLTFILAYHDMPRFPA